MFIQIKDEQERINPNNILYYRVTSQEGYESGTPITGTFTQASTTEDPNSIYVYMVDGTVITYGPFDEDTLEEYTLEIDKKLLYSSEE